MAVRFGASRKSRHVELKYLFVQHLVKHGLLSIKKLPGQDNPSDVFTKYVSKDTLNKHLKKIGIASSSDVVTMIYNKDFIGSLIQFPLEEVHLVAILWPGSNLLV